MFVYVVDKRFSLLVRIFDYLVEPAAYDAGFDGYADGWGHAVHERGPPHINAVHRDLLQHGSEGVYDDTARL